jgi:uncharacterized membrane protein YfcA
VILHVLAALGSGIAVDVLATLVFHYTNQNRAVMAATTNVAVTGCVLYVFVDVNRDVMIAVPYLIGIWIGGIIGIWLKKRLEKPKK